MRIRSKTKRRLAGKYPAARLFALAMALLALAACGCGNPVRSQSAPSPAPAADATPAPTLVLTVVQTVHNSFTGRLTESVFTETVADGESYTVKNMSGSWSLTFTIAFQPGEAVTVVTARPMLPHNDGTNAAQTDTFQLTRDVPLRMDEPALDSVVFYTFTCSDALTPTPLPDDGSVVQFYDRYILGNIRRTLHESKRSAFTVDELALVLFVELKGREISDISELRYLSNIETLTLRNTRVTDLGALSGCERLHTLVLLENDLLDIATLPYLPSLTLLSLTGNYTKEDILLLETLLPDCRIVAETKD